MWNWISRACIPWPACTHSLYQDLYGSDTKHMRSGEGRNRTRAYSAARQQCSPFYSLHRPNQLFNLLHYTLSPALCKPTLCWTLDRATRAAGTRFSQMGGGGWIFKLSTLLNLWEKMSSKSCEQGSVWHWRRFRCFEEWSLKMMFEIFYGFPEK